MISKVISEAICPPWKWSPPPSTGRGSRIPFRSLHGKSTTETFLVFFFFPLPWRRGLCCRHFNLPSCAPAATAHCYCPLDPCWRQRPLRLKPRTLASARTDHWQPRPLLPRAGSGGEGVSKIWWNGYGICLRYLEEVLGRSMFHPWHKMRNTLIYILFVLIWIGQARSFYYFLFLFV